MCAFKDPFGCETVSDSWYNQRLCFLEVSDPDSALQLVSSPGGCHSQAPPDHPGEVTQVVMCPVLPVMYPNHTLMPWNDWGPGSLLFWVCVQLPCLWEGCRTGAAWLSRNVCQPHSSALPMSENPSRERAAEKCHRCLWWSVEEE